MCVTSKGISISEEVAEHDDADSQNVMPLVATLPEVSLLRVLPKITAFSQVACSSASRVLTNLTATGLVNG